LAQARACSLRRGFFVMSAASDAYPHVLAFLVANGLTKSAKAFRKETGVEETGDIDVAAMYDAYLQLNPPKKQKKRKRSTSLDAFELPPAADTSEPVYAEEPQKRKKRAAEEAADEPVKKKAKSTPKVSPKASPKKASPKVSPVATRTSPRLAASPKAAPKAKKDMKVGAKDNKPFQRVDNDKWLKTVKNEGMLITKHLDKGGDSWGDAAAADMLKVKGRDFRKEMAKKKRASWRGGGAIDQTVNSIKFESDSD